MSNTEFPTRSRNFTSNFSNGAPAACRNAVLDAEFARLSNFQVATYLASQGHSAEVIGSTMVYVEACLAEADAWL